MNYLLPEIELPVPDVKTNKGVINPLLSHLPVVIVKKGRGNGPIPMGPTKYLKYKWPTSGYQGLQFTSGQTYTIKVHLNYNNSIYDKKLNNNSKTKTVTAP